MTQEPDLTVLRQAIGQLADLLAEADAVDPNDRTPCEAWTVQDLVDHIVAVPLGFASMVRGESIDWSAPTPPAGDDPVGAFRAHAADLLQVWEVHEGEMDPDWHCAEFAVHTWDLATALRRPTSDLAPEPANRGLAFMQASLTQDNRGAAFGPEQPAPQGGDPYQRIAAFAGRTV